MKKLVRLIRDEIGDGTQTAFAQRIDVNSGHISTALKHNKISPTLKRALIRAGLAKAPRARARLQAELIDEAQRKRLQELAASFDMSWSEFVQAIDSGKILINKES